MPQQNLNVFKKQNTQREKPTLDGKYNVEIYIRNIDFIHFLLNAGAQIVKSSFS